MREGSVGVGVETGLDGGAVVLPGKSAAHGVTFVAGRRVMSDGLNAMVDEHTLDKVPIDPLISTLTERELLEEAVLSTRSLSVRSSASSITIVCS
jgi:hypothetical protein